MPSLKDLRNRIGSVKSTQKITSAMKLVAAAKLRRAQEQAEAGRPYAERMDRMLESLAGGQTTSSDAPKLLAGTGDDQTVLLLVCTADRGLCGAFNSSIIREARRQITELRTSGKTVKLITVGRKGRDALRREFKDLIVDSFTEVGRKQLSFEDANRIATAVLDLFEAGGFDVARVIYNKFQSAISQVVTSQQLIPLDAGAEGADAGEGAPGGAAGAYEFEPDEDAILAELLPRNVAVQIYKALLENAASEQGARMSAMDNATRNAGDLIKRLTLEYNRSRQAAITKELIEIISGAEAV